MNLSLLQLLEKYLGKGAVKINTSLFPHLTIRTNNVAEFFFEASTRHDLISSAVAASQCSIPVTYIGGGSNTAIIRDKLKGLVVKNSYQKKEVIEENGHSVTISVSSGYPMSKLVQETVEEGYEGFEYHKGLPGTIGGAIYMNSKWTKPLTYTGDRLINANLCDHQGNIKKVNREYFKFGYDYSVLQDTKEIILEAVFKLVKTDSKILQKRSNEAFLYRKKTQPFGVFSSGCFFKNISDEDKCRLDLPTNSAGYLIDKSGMKNATEGSFVVSDKHANFIVNTGKGNPADLQKLLDRIKSTVRAKFGVELEEEVKVI